MPGDGPTRPSPSATTSARASGCANSVGAGRDLTRLFCCALALKGLGSAVARCGDPPRVVGRPAISRARLNTGITVIGAGEIYAAGEVALGPGESVTTPWVYAVYSRHGLDGASARVHSMLRRRDGHPSKSRPVLLNTWEAVTFDQSYEKLATLADAAARSGRRTVRYRRWLVR